ELRPGERKESPLTFPDDFLNPALAGKTVRVKVSVNAVKRLDLPELTDTFAQSLGYDSCDALREAMRKGREQSIASIQKSEAQGKLIDNLLKVVDFPLPPSMLDLQINLRVMNLISSMEKQGRSVASLGKTNDELKALARPAAEHVTRSLVLLLKIAEKENLQVTETEVQKEIFNEAQANHEDYNALRERYIRTGLIFSVQDRLLADKAADLVYARANIKEVEAAPEQNSDANPSSETSAQE
ncbi:MAG: trigger factor, partial [Desulfovibrio sp.]|nr:trigger factor [Desulfovibrio sp.]